MDFFESDNFNAQEIAEEREHLSRTLALIKEQIDLLENDGFSYRAVDIYDEQDIEEYRTDKFRHDERKRDIRILKNALKTPYFARMRLKQVAAVDRYDAPSMTRARNLSDFDSLPVDADIYVGANVIFYKDKILVYSHNSPLGNRVYDRFEGGVIEYGGYKYEVQFRRKFDIRNGVLEAVFQDYSKDNGGVVYDKFLAHMLKVKRGDKRLTDIIPTIQANQNAIITRPADENAVVSGCAGCGKTMILLQRLEYLSFNKKLELSNALVVCPSERYKEHIQPVVDDLMIGAARRVTLAELYRELILSMSGIGSRGRRALVGDIAGDETLDSATVTACYSDEIKRKLIGALKPLKLAYSARYAVYKEKLAEYEREVDFARSSGFSTTAEKPKMPSVDVDLNKLTFLPRLGAGLTKAKLYLLLTAYCYVLGKPKFSCALFIDEGQEYYLNEYRLLAECTKATVNIYGDENQQLDIERGIGSFDKLSELWNTPRYALNENYRNAREITAFVNDLLGMNVTSLGLDGGTVEHIGFDKLRDEVMKSVSAGDRVAVIYSPSDMETADALHALDGISRYVCTVKESKGLEYERVFACGKMTDREKYVAYTRALAHLYICEAPLRG
ncbi:MAG: AAA family ATPase [Clostridiales bacterium]|nr:AAA family ATPase [Clostridiales bacterium]